MRFILCAALALSVASCAQLQEAQRQMHEQRMARMEATCARYGFSKGSPEFGRCMMQIDQGERQAEEARQADYERRQSEAMRTREHRSHHASAAPALELHHQHLFRHHLHELLLTPPLALGAIG